MIALLSLALAADLPPKPAAPELVDGDCDRAIPLVIGRAPPASLVVGGLVVCSAVAVPTAEAADLAAVEVWADHVADRYQVDVASAAAQLAIAKGETEWWRSQAARPRVAPVVLLGAGVVAGVGLTVASAFAVSLVAE